MPRPTIDPSHCTCTTCAIFNFVPNSKFLNRSCTYPLTEKDVAKLTKKGLDADAIFKQVQSLPPMKGCVCGGYKNHLSLFERVLRIQRQKEFAW